jgi:predicted O-linked N-acetylglucosamine transferase (SPINDLY family)
MSYATQCIDISGKSDAESREILKQNLYDVIIDTSGVTKSSRLSILAHRCSPVQCHYIGYHATTGLPTIDYIIADDEFIPASLENQFREQIARIPSPWIARHVPANLPLASYKGNWSSTVRLASFNQTAKISLTTLDYWAEALLANPLAILVVKDRFATSKRFQSRVISYLEDKSISASRVTFNGGIPSWEDHMRFYNSVDIVLDATPWSAATTAFDSLSMGVPFVAIRGLEASSRMSSSVLKSANYVDWIADSHIEFAKIVSALSNDIELYRKNRREFQASNLNALPFSPSRLADNLSRLLLKLAAK